MTPDQPSIPSAGEVVRVVVDAQIVLSMFLRRRDQPGAVSPKRALLGLLPLPRFRWLWSPDIIADYERGAAGIENNPKLMRRAIFDRAGFTLLLGALQLYLPVEVTATTLRAARRRIAQAARARDLDLDDAIYLACAVDGDAHLLTSEDSDLLTLGDEYQGVKIVSWNGLKQALRERGLTI
jgi:predicted nucleic acid-binding protein